MHNQNNYELCIMNYELKTHHFPLPWTTIKTV